MAGEEMINLTRLGDFHADMTVDAHILKRSTTYAVDDKVNKGLIYLKCTQAGTTASTALSLSGVSVGDTLTDGSVIWKVLSIKGVPEGGGTGAGLEDWESNHNYAVDDIYVYEGEIYKTLIAFTSGSTEDSRTKVNNIVPSVWTANTAYTAGDIIEHTDVTTLKKVYYNVISNFTSGATFEVTAEMQELQVVEEYVPHPLTNAQVQNLINGFNPSGGGGVYTNRTLLFEGFSSILDSSATIELSQSATNFDYLVVFGSLDNTSYAEQGFGVYYVPYLLNGGGAKFTSFSTTDAYASCTLTLSDSTHISKMYGTHSTHNWGNFYITRVEGIKFISSPNNYSTEEQRIGTWIDGKPLYQKTFSGTTPSTGDTDGSVVLLSSIFAIHNIDGYVKHTNMVIPLNFNYTSTNYVTTYYSESTYDIRIKQANYNSMPVYITIQYTKTTD